jgi:hypothetical protein
MGFVPGGLGSGGLLPSMVTPAVLISAAGTLVFSTVTRLARIVDRARVLAEQLEAIDAQPEAPLADERRREIERQLAVRARRSHLVQKAVTSFYVALGFFVGTTVAVGVASLLPALGWLPGTLGIAGTLVLFLGCVQLIRETRLALDAVDSEMAFTLELGDRRRRVLGAGTGAGAGAGTGAKPPREV